jgi:hypothetical protein
MKRSMKLNCAAEAVVETLTSNAKAIRIRIVMS